MQAVSAVILPGGPNKCWICCDSRIYCPTRGHDIYDGSSVDSAKMLDKEGINIGNFMINCQQSEENAICAVFPDSIVYLCAFHRLQAWLRWIVNTKNGVSNYQTYCMGLLRAVGDTKTEDAYTKALMELQKSHVWSRFPNYRNYYTQQWAPKKKVTR